MKLSTNYFEQPIEIKENETNVIVMENKKQITSFINDLCDDVNNSTSNFYLSDNLKELSVANNCAVCIDFFNYNIDKKVSTKVYKLLENYFSKDAAIQESYMNLQSNIYNFLDNLIFNFDINLSFNDEYDITSIFKLADIKVNEDNSSLLNKIITIIKVASHLNMFKILFFVNLKTFFNIEELKEIYKQSYYYKIHLILIENKKTDTIDSEKYIVIDEDLCQII